MRNVDTLPLLISGGDFEQQLGVPAMLNSTGREQVEIAVLSAWNLEDNVAYFCCYTRESNMG